MRAILTSMASIGRVEYRIKDKYPDYSLCLRNKIGDNFKYYPV